MAKDVEKKPKKESKHFFKDFKAELKKVIWPNRSQVVNNTVIVIVIVAIVTALCFVLDFAFEALNTYGIDKLKSAVQGSSSNELVQENTVEEDANVIDETTDTVENSENDEAEE